MRLAWPTSLLPLPSFAQREGRSGIEETLEQRARGGDKRALEALLRENARAISELCRCLAGVDEGRDAAQESLEKVVMSIARFDPEKGSFRAWSLTVARNTCRDRLRRRGLERRLFYSEPLGEEGDAPMEHAGDQPDVERTALARIETERLQVALETLAPRMRAAIVLFHVHESSYEEIAGALDVPIGTVMTWLHRGRKRLRVLLEEATA